MADPFSDLDLDLSDLSLEEWCVRLDAIGEEHGFFNKIGTDHSALFIDAGKSLLVTFETADAARRRAVPRGFDHVRSEGWSLLSLFSNGETWFRDPGVYGTFDRLTDDGFFEDFDRVLFMGTGSCGYAAAAFSVAAPGARVLALRPQATLAPAIAGWDRRFLAERRRDFTTRYGYAPEMIDAAERAWIVHDPGHAPDAMHAALFHRANVTMLRAPMTNIRLEPLLDLMEVMPEITLAAMEGRLDRLVFARAWRQRRACLPWLKGLYKRVEVSGRTDLLARICRYGLTTADADWFRDRIAAASSPAAAAE